MTSSFRDRWVALSPHLDQALELDDAGRAAWLDGLRRQDPALATELEALLAAGSAAERQGYLEEGPLRPAPSLAGHTFGAYTLESLLGQGGMGSVWLARRSDGRYAGQVAVKLLNVSYVGGSGEERFRREGQILARLAHPHIARLLDAGVSPGGQPYLVLEHVDGLPIDRWCDQRGLGVEARVRLALDVLSAVAHAHANLVVHRDIKPSNVLVGADGQVRLLDFGIAKLIEGDGSSAAPGLSREGVGPLTPEYAAPEQVTGGAITTATDVYALGVLIYVLLAGRHPAGPTARSAAELLKAAVETDPPRPSTVVALTTGAETPEALASRRGTTPERLRAALGGDLDTIVAKALKKDPAERYPSALALADDLRRYLNHEPVAARPDTLSYRAARFVRRHRLTVGLAALAFLALLAGLAGTLWQSRAAARERDLALAQLERAESINEFTDFVLGRAVPAGRAVTVREILERAERLADKRLESDPALAVDLLVDIGGIYAIREESANARRVLERAYEASLRLDDPALRARALCSRARAVASDDLEGARRLVDEGLALTSAEARFDGVAAGCLVDRGTIAMDGGATDAVLESGRLALARLERRPSAYVEVRASALQLLAVGRQMQGDTAGADEAFERAAQYLERVGRADSLDTAVLLHNWAINVALTSPLRALQLNRRVIEIFAGDSPESVPLPSRANHAVQLNRLARYAEAREANAAALAQARAQGNVQSAGGSGLQLARSLRGLSDLAGARAALARAAADLRSSYPRGHRVLAELAREQGLLAAAEGRRAEALRLLAEAAQAHAAVPQKHVSQVETLVALSELLLADGRAEEAERQARAALAVAEGFRGRTPSSAWVGLGQLALAEALDARGQAAQARALLEQAVAHLVPTLGEGHPAVARARQRLARG